MAYVSLFQRQLVRNVLDQGTTRITRQFTGVGLTQVASDLFFGKPLLHVTISFSMGIGLQIAVLLKNGGTSQPSGLNACDVFEESERQALRCGNFCGPGQRLDQPQSPRYAHNWTPRRSESIRMRVGRSFVLGDFALFGFTHLIRLEAT